ncbi:uncharacterized protein LOC133564121 isoform X2 [Nerophis ophidion]|uniref:uncharacterized protein LOC133564121 isoform X2 n=1 Tax=Nerophis ophidion TaxID=159077 RepID=UPI002AE0435C|nr:uncharacterized protein LOC133564121 isoform X2 [Nerophis ophidion]
MKGGIVKKERVESQQDEEEDVYEVERIIEMRVEEGEVLYRVRWKGYCSDDDTWEPEAHLEDCRKVLLAFKKATTDGKKEAEAKKVVQKALPTKSDLFEADSESDSDKDRLSEAPVKKKKKKKVREEEEELQPRKEKKKDKWRDEFKTVSAPETDEEETVPPSSPESKEKQAKQKKHLIDSDDEEEELAPPKKDKTKDGGKHRKDRGEKGKKKKAKKERKIESSEHEGPAGLLEDDRSEGLSDAQLDETSAKPPEKTRMEDKAKHKKGKLDVKLQGIKELILDRKSKKGDFSLKESSLHKLKSLTSRGREEAAPHSSDSSDSSSLHKKAKSKSQEVVSKPSQSYSFSLDSDEREAQKSATKPRPGDDSRERLEESQRLSWERKGPADDRKKRREDGEPKLHGASDSHISSQDPLETTDKSDRGPAALSLGMDLNLDWMTLDDFQKHLNGEDEILSAPLLSPSEVWDAVKSGDYTAVKLALNSKEQYNLDLETKDAEAGVVAEEVSSPAVQDDTQMGEPSHSQNPHQRIETDCQDDAPRLRRTKSIIRKGRCPEDADDLYETTSVSDLSVSADEYVSHTTFESEDSEDSLTIRSKKPFRHEFLDDPGSISPPACDSTTVDHMDLDINSTGTEEPCSSQETIDAVFVCAPLKKHGNRVYSKRHYCLYCSKPYAKMARHLESVHKNTLEVAKALSFPKSSMERRKQLEYIRNKGNYAHNAAIMESGKGELVPFKRPHKETKGNDFMHCAYCQGLFTRKVLWRHMRSCRFKPASVTQKPGKNRVQSMCTYTGPVPSSISKQLWGVISAMIPDPITEIIKDDLVITDVGHHLLNKRGMSEKNQHFVREKMRELGRLVHNARKVTTLKKMEDFVNPKNYLEMVKAVKCTCGFDSDTNKFCIPSLATKLGNSLVKVSKLLKAQGLIMNNEELVRNATQFQEVHSEKWNELVSVTALRNIAEGKWNAPLLMSFTEDVQKLHQFLTQMHDECSSALSESSSTKAWSDLTKVCLTQIILFNRPREGEVAATPLLAFLSRDTADPHEDLDWALSEVEKKLCSLFTRIVIRGKRGRPVPILLTPKMVCALELLVKCRETCGVLRDNTYLFARPAAMTHFRGSDCIRHYAKACHATCPVSLTSTKLRTHAATLSTVLNMTDTEMDQLANFLGHDIRIHREFSRLPEKTLQLAKISKVLMALEQGRLSEFHGKNLDEISIGPNESVVETEEEDLTREDESCSFLDNEGVFPTTEEEAIPPPKRLKLLSKEEEVSSGDGAVRHSAKGLAAQKR